MICRPPTVESSAQSGSKVLEVSVRPSMLHDAGAGVDCRKVALERDVARCHVDASTHALERTTPAVETAGGSARAMMKGTPQQVHRGLTWERVNGGTQHPGGHPTCQLSIFSKHVWFWFWILDTGFTK